MLYYIDTYYFTKIIFIRWLIRHSLHKKGLQIYTNEDLKWDAPNVRPFKSSLVSDHEEIKMEHFNSSLV